MSRKIYLLRHGKPNIEGKKCIGLTDVSLSPEGKQQARSIGGWLRGHDIQQVYSSPLIRCRETAQIVVKEAFDSSKTIHIREELREISVGQWENLTFQEIKDRYPKEYEKRGENIGYYAPPEGESFDEGGRRFGECVDSILEDSRGDILIVAHAGVIRGYLCQLSGISLNQVMDVPQPYGGLTILEENGTGSPRICISKVGWKPSALLNQEEIEVLYQKCDTPDPVIRHMRAVAYFLERIKSQLAKEQQEQYDWDLLNKAALLHDIKRTEKNHAKAGAGFLEKEGYPDIAGLVQCHHDSDCAEGILTEEELLFYADKRVSEDKIVSLDERFEESKKKCLTPEALKKHSKLYEKSKMIERKLYKCNL